MTERGTDDRDLDKTDVDKTDVDKTDNGPSGERRSVYHAVA